MSETLPLDDHAAQRTLASGAPAPTGREYWRSLEERAGQAAPELERLLDQEGEDSDELSRRQLLRLLGGSLALGGLAACTRQPEEKILPYARHPADFVPGRSLHYATAMPWASGALGLLVTSHMGRPTKVEGNPLHPASLGATDAPTQASVLDLYDPHRSQVVLRRGAISTWEVFGRELGAALEPLRARGGRGLAILTRTVTSPTLGAQLEALSAELPGARWHQYEPLNRDHERAGSLLAFGEDLAPRHDVGAADVILALDADFLGARPDGVRHARAFARRRRPDLEGAAPAMNRLYAVESSATLTGAAADHRLGLAPSGIEHFLRALAERLGVPARGERADLRPAEQEWLEVVAKDLQRAGSKALLVPGASLSPAAHALVHALHAKLGALGSTVRFGPPAAVRPVDQGESIRALARDLAAGEVELLVVLEANPVYDAPAELDFAAALERATLRVHLGHEQDETARLCHWHLPASHFLESWSDARAFDGTLSIVQPLIAPLYRSRSSHELVAQLAGRPTAKGYELVREHWQGRLGEAGFEAAWRRALHDGVLAGSAEPARVPRLRELTFTPPEPRAAGLELALRPDPSAHDGRFAGNAWLQELPRPLSKLVWDNALLVSVADAARLGLAEGRGARLSAGGRRLEAPVHVDPGQPAGAVTLHLGYGRRAGGPIGRGVGVDAYPLRSSEAPWNVALDALEPTGRRHRFATTQSHHSMEGRPLILEATGAQYAAGADLRGHEPEQTLIAPFPKSGPQWGMVLDLSSCIGCNACVVACQAENNIPVVGKDEVRRGRDLHWIRIDRYYAGSEENPDTRFQPVPCMHCEQAPCELVCPVGATVHSHDGLNDMVYNRCVGTRYCSNNCPYKVRRFNFFQYADLKTPSLALQRNPEVTVRTRGVMEKCTYCVQRIRKAGIEARVAGRELEDGEVRTACQQVCPSEAITFGDVADPDSAVSKRRAQRHAFGLLTELNTRPRTTYQRRLSNPAPELDRPADAGAER